jgi:hypothetical protein
MNPEVPDDLLDGHTGPTATSDPHNIVAELLRVRLGHGNILPAQHPDKPTQMSPIHAADPFDKLAVRYEATLHIATINIWLRALTKTTS